MSKIKPIANNAILSRPRVATANGQRILAGLNSVDHVAIVSPEEWGLSEQSSAQQAQAADHRDHSEPSEPPQPMDTVRRKIEGQRLTLEGVCAITPDISHNRYSQMEMTAFLPKSYMES